MDGLLEYYDDDILHEAILDILYFCGIDELDLESYNGIVQTMVNYGHAKVLEDKLDQVDEYIKKVM